MGVSSTRKLVCLHTNSETATESGIVEGIKRKEKEKKWKEKQPTGAGEVRSPTGAPHRPDSDSNILDDIFPHGFYPNSGSTSRV